MVVFPMFLAMLPGMMVALCEVIPVPLKVQATGTLIVTSSTTDSSAEVLADDKTIPKINVIETVVNNIIDCKENLCMPNLMFLV